MDVHDKKTRSFNMSQIKGKDTKPEEIVRKYLYSMGYRYRKNDNRLTGSPDIVLPKYRTIIFVNGCFWHGHEGCKRFVWPQNNADFWKKKIEANIDRDRRNEIELVNSGWNVITIWECQLKPSTRIDTLESLCNELTEIYKSLNTGELLQEDAK